jgi:hypothetical protein
MAVVESLTLRQNLENLRKLGKCVKFSSFLLFRFAVLTRIQKASNSKYGKQSREAVLHSKDLARQVVTPAN